MDIGITFCRILIKSKISYVTLAVCNFVSMSVLGNPLSPKFNIYDIRAKCTNPPLCYDFTELKQFLNRDDVREELGVQGRLW